MIKAKRYDTWNNKGKHDSRLLFILVELILKTNLTDPVSKGKPRRFANLLILEKQSF